jgi:hypothetical protein
MLLYRPQLSRRTLEELADLLIESGRLSAADKPAAIDRAFERLSTIYARNL